MMRIDVPFDIAPLGSGYNIDDVRTTIVERHLRWLREKDELAQDVFLVAPPGPDARWLVSLYAEQAKRELEIVIITRDTCEADLKQRRELINGNVQFSDGPVVKAALSGIIFFLGKNINIFIF
jgi:hypothetical protein